MWVGKKTCFDWMHSFCILGRKDELQQLQQQIEELQTSVTQLGRRLEAKENEVTELKELITEKDRLLEMAVQAAPHPPPHKKRRFILESVGKVVLSTEQRIKEMWWRGRWREKFVFTNKNHLPLVVFILCFLCFSKDIFYLLLLLTIIK